MTSESDQELPGMWSHTDFEGGDPDERSYAERGWPAVYQVDCFQCSLWRTFDQESDAQACRDSHRHRGATIRKIWRTYLEERGGEPTVTDKRLNA